MNKDEGEGERNRGEDGKYKWEVGKVYGVKVKEKGVCGRYIFAGRVML